MLHWRPFFPDYLNWPNPLVVHTLILAHVLERMDNLISHQPLQVPQVTRL